MTKDISGAVAPEKAKTELDIPSLFHVVLINDDFTPMEFVVEVLMRFFGMSESKANEVTTAIHTDGKKICGTYTREIAETKVSQVTDYARRSEYPLICDMERAQ